MSRRSATRTLAGVGVSLASLAIGIVGARAISGTDDSAATSSAAPVDGAAPVLLDPADAAVTVDAPPAASYDDLIPVLELVAVGTDPAIADLLLFPPDDGAGTDESGAPFSPGGMPEPGEPAVDGGVAPPEGLDPAGAPSDPTPISDDSATPPGSGGGGEGGDAPVLGEPPLPPTPYYWSADGWLLPFPVQFVDACAGATPRPPGMLPPPRCPEGVGGTVTGDTAVRPLAAWVNSPHLFDDDATPEFVGCPAGTAEPGDGRDGVTLVATAPLASAQVHWRVRGSLGDWRTLNIDPAVLAVQQEAVQVRLADGSLAAGTELIGHCATIDRDLNRPYELYATGLDTAGRPFTTITITLADLTPEGRPPSVIEVNSRLNQATVKSWTTTTGSVDFRWFPLAADEEPPLPNCDGMLEYPLTRSTGAPPLPSGVWDPQYRAGHNATIQLPDGGGAVVCVTTFDTPNLLRPLATEVFVVRGPRRQVATIDLMGLRLNDGVTIPAGSLSVAARYMVDYVPDDGCSTWWTNSDEPVAAPGVATTAPLWHCARTPLPVDERGYVKVPITVTRRVAPSGTDPFQRMVVGVPLQFDDCTRGYCPPKPNEYYEVPIPTGDTALRGCVFDCGGPPPSAGVAIVRVSYDVAGSGNTGSSTLLSSSDREADPVGGTPRITLDERTDFVPTGGFQFSELRAEYRMFSDRPVTMVSGRVVPEVAPGSRCAGERPVEVLSSGTVTELAFAVTVSCPGTTYSAFVTVRDADGVDHEVIVAYDRSANVVGRNVTTTVEFLGDTAGHDAGFLYQFRVGIAGSSAVVPHNAWSWSNLYPSGSSAVCVAHGRTVARATRPIEQLFVLGPDALYIGMSVNFTTVCDGSGSGRGAIGEVGLSGSVDFESLADGEPIVITSPTDARLQVRITVTATDWYLQN